MRRERDPRTRHPPRGGRQGLPRSDRSARSRVRVIARRSDFAPIAAAVTPRARPAATLPPTPPAPRRRAFPCAPSRDRSDAGPTRYPARHVRGSCDPWVCSPSSGPARQWRRTRREVRRDASRFSHTRKGVRTMAIDLRDITDAVQILPEQEGRDCDHGRDPRRGGQSQSRGILRREPRGDERRTPRPVAWPSRT